MKVQFLLLFLLSTFLNLGEVFGQTSLGFMIKNEQFVNGNVEFDVYASASSLGTFHSRGQVYINYSQTFGDSVVSKNRSSFQQLSLLNESLPMFGNKYSTIGFADNAPNRIALTWQTNFPATNPSALAHTEVPSALTPLYHISLQIVDPNVPISISFEQSLMNGQQFMIVAPTSEIPYSDWVFPVELLDFQATPLDAETVRLDWLTAKELNNDHFVIEKRVEGQSDYQLIAKVDGAGTTDNVQEYSIVDKSLMGSVNYYRLKQVDIDGTATYSKMIEVRMIRDEQPLYTLYPNPAEDFVNLKYMGKLIDDREYELINMQGITFQTGKLFAAENYGVRNIQLGDLSPGLYFIRIQGELKSISFVKK